MVTVCTVQLSLYCAVLHCTALYTARSVCHSNQLENTAAASNNYCSYNYNNNNSSSEEDNTVRWQQCPQQQWCCYQGCERLAEDCAITARQHQRYLWTLLAIRPANGVHQPRPHQHRHLYTFLCELRTSDIIIMWVSWEIWTDKKVDSHSSRYVSSLYVKIFERMSWVKLCVAYIAFYISLFLADLSRYVIYSKANWQAQIFIQLMPLLSSIKTQVSSGGGGTAGAGASLLLLLGLGWVSVFEANHTIESVL